MAGVSSQDIVGAAYELLGAPYRHWHVGDPIPMWRKDGVGDPPPPWHLHNVGVMGSDLLNFALERIAKGLWPLCKRSAFSKIKGLRTEMRGLGEGQPSPHSTGLRAHRATRC
jgi:hypothetical protein